MWRLVAVASSPAGLDVLVLRYRKEGGDHRLASWRHAIIRLMTSREPMKDAPQHRTPVPSSATKTFFANRPWLLALVLAVVTFIAYQPVWRTGFIWDDDCYVTDNTSLRTADGLWKIWAKPGTTIQYYPLAFTSFWLEYHLWGLRPFGYHLVNVLLHALSALLLWRVLRKLEISGAWLAAAIFAIHPVQVESVAWITERKNVLSGLFYLLTASAFLRFRPFPNTTPSRPWDWRFYPVVIALFLGALLSKTVTCSLPAVLLLLVWWKKGGVESRDVLVLSPLFVLGVASGFMTTWMEKHSVGASGTEWALSFAQRCLVAGRALWFYAGKLFWPHKLTFIYPHWEIDTGVWWQYTFPVAAVGVLVALWLLRSRLGRGPLVAVLFFAGTLVPALGFFDIFPFRYSFVADHFQYLACIGLISLAVSTGAVIYRRAVPWGANQGKVAAAIVLLLLSTATRRQTRIYQDLTTLWRDTLAKNPQCWMALGNLGNVYLREGKISDAMGYFEEALRIKPDYVEMQCNLGLTLAQVGKTQSAIEHYEQALRIEPNLAMAHCNLGVALAQVGRIPEAIEHLQQALRVRPSYAEAHYNLGTALARSGRLTEAMGHWEQALRIKPDFAEVHCNLGNALQQTGRPQEAIEHYEHALRLKPDYAEAQFNLGLVLFRLGRLPEAIGHYDQAIRLKPDYAEAHCNLGNALEQTGRRQEALGHWEQALRAKPDYPEAQNNLAWLMANSQTIAWQPISTRWPRP
jgi:protein O-mannosyl-transferase